MKWENWTMNPNLLYGVDGIDDFDDYEGMCNPIRPTNPYQS